METEDKERLARVEANADRNHEEINTLRERFESYITRHEFNPVKMIAFGMAGAAMLGMVGAILSKLLGF